MQGVYAVGGSGIASLELRKEAVSLPGPGEALIRINAATLNFRDLAFITGRLPGMTKLPDYVPLSCGAGEVVAIGDDVTRVAIGDRVQPLFALGWLDGPQPTMDMLGGLADGVARTHAVFPADSLIRLPDMLSDLEAATLPCAGLTAWNALTLHRPIKPGEWVLCPGTGGVSIAALQFAKAAGANVVITSSSNAKLARARALGADVTVNYRDHPDWVSEARKALGGRGVDVVVDVVGADQFETNLALLEPGGLIATIGFLGSEFSWGKEAAGDPRTGRISTGNRKQHEAMLGFIAEHSVRPVVDVVYPLERLADAYRRLENGRFFGKVGVTLV